MTDYTGVSFSIQCCDADRAAVAEAMHEKFAGAELEFVDCDLLIPEASSITADYGHSIHGVRERFEDGTSASVGTEVLLFRAQSLLTSRFQDRIWKAA